MKNKTLLLGLVFILLLVMTTGASAEVTQADLVNGIIGFFDGSHSSSTAFDVHSVNDGTASNIRLLGATGQILDGFDFTQGDDAISIPHSGEYGFNYADSFSVNMWFKTSSSTGYTQLVGMERLSSSGVLAWGVRTDEGKLVFSVALSGVGNSVAITSSTNYADNTWHMATATYNNTAMELFVDGISVGTATYGSTGDASSQDLMIGARKYSSTVDSYYNGLIDEVAIFNRVLTNEEILKFFDIQKDGLTSGTYDFSDAFITDILFSNFNATSSNVQTNTSEKWNTGGIVYANSSELTFTFDTNVVANCTAVLGQSWNYTEAISENPAYLLSQDTMNHEITIIDDLSLGQNNLALSCSDGTKMTSLLGVDALKIWGDSSLNVNKVNITNTRPIWNDKTLTGVFNISDGFDTSLNAEISWWKKPASDTTPCYWEYQHTCADDPDPDCIGIWVEVLICPEETFWERHTTNNETWTGVTQNTDYSTTDLVGRVPYTETNNWDVWLMELTITDGTDTLVMNSTNITIENTPPDVSYSGSDTSYLNPKNVQEDVTFTVEGIDLQGDNVQMKVCRNENATWGDCELACENLVGVPFSTSLTTSISCSYTIPYFQTREHLAYPILYDGDYLYLQSVDYYVNQFPTLSLFDIRNTDNSSTLYFGETIDYIEILQDDTFDNDTLDVYVTVEDPDGVVKVNNASMTKTNISGTNYDRYSTNFLLDAVGNWIVTLTTTDSDGASTTVSEIVEVLVREVSTNGRIYGYDFETFPTYSEYETELDTYSYYLGEIRITKDTTWADVSNFIQTAKTDSNVVGLTLYDDLTDVNATLSYLDTFDVLTNANHLLAMRNIKIYVADGVTENAENSDKINEITKKIFQEINNRYPITIRNYNHTDINTDYAKIDTQDYITANTGTDYINQEMTIFNAKTDKTRMYYNLSTEFKTKALNWQSQLIDNFRSEINLTSTITNPLVIELNNGDLIIANNQSSTQTISFEAPTGLTGYDLYNLNNKKIEQRNVSGTINIDVGQETAYLLYKTNLSKVQVLDDGRMFIYSNDPTEYPDSIDYMSNATDTNSFNFLASGTSYKENARIFLRDPSYTYADFLVYYGWLGSEYIADWSKYKYVVLASEETPDLVSDVADVTEAYGYIHIVDYSNKNCLASTGECWYENGCLDSWGRGNGTPCDAWNRSRWMEDKIDDIDTWTNMSLKVNIFIDGLDYGVVNDDGLFGDALTDLTEYAKITKDRKTILNTYTSYADYSNLADMVMRESSCSRWEGTTSEPTYHYEDIALDIERASFHKAHGQPILLQSFGAKNDTERAYYCYMQNKVLYGNLGYHSYNQPDFWNYIAPESDQLKWNYQQYPELGSALEEDYTQETADTFTRRFEKGIVTINTTSKEVDFQQDKVITQMEFCGYYQDNGEGSTNNEGYMNFRVNNDYTTSFRVYNDDLVHGVKTEKCVDIPVEYYDPTGMYEIEFWYIDLDGNLIGNGGLFMFTGITDNDGVSFYENTEVSTHPPSTKNLFEPYNNLRNWQVKLTIDAVSTGNAFDRLDSVITRTETGDEELTVKFSSLTGWNLPIEDKLMFMNKSVFNGIRMGDTYLNYSEDASCITDLPTYNTTIINGETWEACYYDEDPAVDGYYVKVVIPHLSDQEYTIDGNTPPEVVNETITLLDLTNHTQTWELNFDYSDADGNEIISCNVLSNNETFNSTPINNTCNVEITVPFDTTQLNAYLYVEDEYNKSSENGANYTLATINYDEIENSSVIGNLTEQHFIKYWNITQTHGAFENISWDYENLSTRIINISNETTRDYLNYTTNVLTYSDLEYIPASGSDYTVNRAEEVYRFFNVTGNLTTGEEVPSFQVELPQPQYTTGTQSMTKECGVFNAYTNFTSGSELVATIQPQNDSSQECYYYLYPARIIYSNSVINYTDDSGIRTYNYENEDENSTYGRKINFMFEDLKTTTTKIRDIIPYSELPNWADRLSSSRIVHRFAEPNSYTEEVNGVDFTYQDVTGSELIRFDWEELNTPIDALFINLTWTYTAPEEPTEPTSPATGGGGGGGSTDPPSTSTDMDLTKELCDITIIPSKAVITDKNPIVELIITNRESISYTPEYEFKDVVGSASIQKHVQLTNEVGTLLKNTEKTFGIKYQGGIFGSTEVNGKSELVLSSTRCRDIIIPIEMNITASNPLSELISGEEKTLKRITNFVNEPITQHIDWAKMWILMGLLALLFGTILWDKQWSNSEATNWIVKGIAWLFLTLLATGLISVIIKAIIGG